MISASLIIIGDELLEGKTTDFNFLYLITRLTEMGITISRISFIGDRQDEIEKLIKEFLLLSPVLFTIGGLGATPDDLTREAVSHLFNRPLLLDEATLKKIEDYYARLNVPVPEEATKQALYPQGALLLENPVGLCPGIVFKEGEKYLILLPGVFTETEKIFETGVLPFLETSFSLAPNYSCQIRTTGLTEAEIMERLAQMKRRLFRNCSVRYFPSILGVDLHLTTDKGKDFLEEMKREVINRLTPYVYGMGGVSLEEKVGELVLRRGLTLAVAESCTGGLLSDRLTNVPGSSNYFLGGVVAYTNEIKKMTLGVKEETLKRFGAVSKEVALEMANGVRERFGAGIGISITGIAGPAGGTPKKPVGLVWIGLATANKAFFKEFHLSGDRRAIKEMAVQRALDITRRYLEGCL